MNAIIRKPPDGRSHRHDAAAIAPEFENIISICCTDAAAKAITLMLMNHQKNYSGIGSVVVNDISFRKWMEKHL